MRVKRKVQVRDTHGRWIETEGIFSDDQICAHPDCIRITTTTQRRKSKKTNPLTHCSKTCRGSHQKIIAARKREQALFTPPPPSPG